MPAPYEHLTPRQERFAREYLVDRNGTRAAKAAGYAPKGAHVEASKLLRNPKVRAIIDSQQEQVAQSLHLSAQRTLEEIARIAYLDPADLIDASTGRLKHLADIPEDTRRAIGEVIETEAKDGSKSKRFKTHSKLEALGLLAKHFHLTNEQATNVTVQVAVQGGGLVDARLAEYSLDELRAMRESLALREESVEAPPIEGTR